MLFNSQKITETHKVSHLSYRPERVYSNLRSIPSTHRLCPYKRWSFTVPFTIQLGYLEGWWRACEYLLPLICSPLTFRLQTTVDRMIRKHIVRLPTQDPLPEDISLNHAALSVVKEAQKLQKTMVSYLVSQADRLADYSFSMTPSSLKIISSSPF